MLSTTTHSSRASPRATPRAAPLSLTRYICSNETINGTEFHTMPEFDDGVPLVVDMSVSFG